MSQASRHVVYRYPDPSPVFSRQQLNYIESIHTVLNESELRRARTVEKFTLNLDLKTVVCFEIPGLRSSHDTSCVYVKRFSNESYNDMSNRILDLVLPKSFGKDVRKYIKRPYRITLPSTDRFYPFVFGADSRKWRKNLKDCAVALGTVSGEFDHDRFILSNGQTFAFNTLTIEVAQVTDLAEW